VSSRWCVRACPGYGPVMTETQRESETSLSEKDVERDDQLERAELDPEDQPNAPNREPTPERVGPDADTED
jgi:hypothetical protein